MTATTRFLGSPSESIVESITLHHQPAVPMKIGNYSIIQPIGRGGMGTVFEVEHTSLGRRFALKLLSESLRDNREAVERFRTETLALGKLGHPNIVFAIDAGVWHGSPYLVTELLRGNDLGRQVSENGKLDVLTVVSIAEQLAGALEYAHQSGYFHRDIKPSNVFLQPDGKAKLLDFGLVRTESNSSLTQAGNFMGTVDFVAPEQAGNATLAAASSDIYSLGCTLIYLLSGEGPFPDRRYPSHLAKLQAHLRDEPLWFAAPEDPTPTWLKSLIRLMVSKRPEDRPSSCRVIQESLQNQQYKNQPSTTTSNSVNLKSSKFLKAVAFSTASALAIALVSIGLMGTSRLYSQSGSTKHPDSAASSKTIESSATQNRAEHSSEAASLTKPISSKTLPASSVNSARGITLPSKSLGNQSKPKE